MQENNNNQKRKFEDVYSNSFENMEFEDIFSTNKKPQAQKPIEDIYSAQPKKSVSAFDESVDDVFSSIPQFKREQKPTADYSQYVTEEVQIITNRQPQHNRVQNRVPNRSNANLNNGDIYMSRQRNTQDFEEFDEFDTENGEYEDISSSPKNRKKKKSKKPLGCFTGILVVILALVIGAGAAVNMFLDSLLSTIKYSDEARTNNAYISEDKLTSSKDVTNILLLGIDRRTADEASRADTMMLLSIDKQNKKLKLTSFLRDSYVDIPGKGYAKLNSACTYGGAKLVMDTIEYNFKIKIDNYVLVDFEMFSKIVDQLGGVDVEVTQKEADFMVSQKHGAPETPIKLKEGVNNLDGEAALWYCRIRYLDSDFFRTQRQRKVVSAMVDKAKKTSPTELVDIAKSVLPLVETGFQKKELKKIAMGALGYLKYDIAQQQIPAEGTWKNDTTKGGQYILSFDISKNSDILKDFIYSKDKETTSSSENESKS
ncbi:MAG: LCP family protein [Clostridiales bacterium]|nr:LCP family protein [Clostridiales bacterium]